MLLRIRSKEGMQRIQVDPSETFESLGQKIIALLGISDANSISVNNQPNPATATPIVNILDKTLASTGLKHGDIVFVTYKSAEQVAKQETPSIKQDAVDDFLEKQSGMIPRSKDPKFCRHGDNAMCDYCMPLEPYNAQYLEEHKIKHMSFHAYLRQIDALKQSKSISTNVKQLPPLEEPDYRVKVPCSGGHAPWPEGICTKCQPSAITLQRQTYRMVDHVEFSSAALIERFLNYWRQSGCQRIGYLYGRYEPYMDVPLGIKAVVEAIYEPPQESHIDGLKLVLPWEEEAMVNSVAESCGLKMVGMVFTDLTDDGTGRGTVYAKRHMDSYFLSSLECSFAAEMQRHHPNPSKFATKGKFGSKFITCVISGDVDGNIDVKAYQVSETATALKEADIIEPSRKPSVMRVKDSIPHERYVPEVFYKYKNEYGVVVKESAKPTFPVEYLLVNVTNGFPHNPSPLFNASQEFPVANRLGMSQQSMESLARYLGSTRQPEEIKNLLSDFHALCFIRSTNMLTDDEFKRLCQIITQPDTSTQELDNLSGWKTLSMVLKEVESTARYSTPSSSMSRSGTTSGAMTPALSEFAEISCRHCTFANPGGAVNCEMCGLPLAD